MLKILSDSKNPVLKCHRDSQFQHGDCPSLQTRGAVDVTMMEGDSHNPRHSHPLGRPFTWSSRTISSYAQQLDVNSGRTGMIQGYRTRGPRIVWKRESQDSTKSVALRSDTIVHWYASRRGTWDGGMDTCPTSTAQPSTTRGHPWLFPGPWLWDAALGDGARQLQVCSLTSRVVPPPC